MKTISRLVSIGAFLGLAGCAGLGGTFQAEDYLTQDIQGNDFNAHLARNYQDLAELEANDHVNWYQSGLYTLKGKAALDGETVLPWEPEEYGLGADAAALRDRLLAALEDGRAQRPEPCARAQAMYDAYLHAADSVYPPQEDERMDQFMEALEDCEGRAMAAPAAPDVFTIYFGFDRHNLTAEAQRVIDAIVGAVQNMASPMVDIDGHTDTAGPSEYNIDLGERRANAVKDALEGRGVPSGQIRTETFGESELAVETPDGTPEPLNRRAVITIK